MQPQQPMKNPGLAAILSAIWVGFGQIYNGQITKGLIMMVSYVLSALACFIVIGFITTPILWVWGIYDAYKNAERINQVQGMTQAINVEAEVAPTKIDD